MEPPKPFWSGVGTATFILGAASGPLQVVVVNPSQIESNEAVIPFGRQAEHGLLPIASSYLDSSEPATPKVESVSSTLRFPSTDPFLCWSSCNPFKAQNIPEASLVPSAKNSLSVLAHPHTLTWYLRKSSAKRRVTLSQDAMFPTHNF